MSRTPPPSALVTDGLWRKSLSAARSLGRAGFDVHVMGDTRLSPAFWSRHTRQRIIAPLASDDPDGFLEALLRHAERVESAEIVLLPMEDATLRCVSRHRERLAARYRFLIPSEESLAIAFDKERTRARAERLGIPVPRSLPPASPGDVARATREFASWVVKPRQGSGSQGIVYSGGPEIADWTRHWETHGPLLVQERIPPEGEAIGASFLFDAEGRCRAEFVHRRLRQYPVTGGPSTDRESIHHPLVLDWSRRMLESLEWKGVAMVEWKVDPATGEPRLLEINPRFWGSLALAVRAGVDFPALYARACLGREVDKPTYADGVRSRWMIPGELLRYASSREREPLGRFLKGALTLSEEWDPRDPAGALATLVSTGLLALNPRYWKYLRRG